MTIKYLTEEELNKIRFAFMNYIHETYPNISDNGAIKHLKRFEANLKAND